ncbi:nucleoside hydrolase [Jiangella muralis]|uniref:nucleoside hydrolase n=1 Tax=Jiangella muralis TaxID=702383 RepID=UPI00069FDE71|nr:nucleoside hydrolase [Jiangella muralis]
MSRTFTRVTAALVLAAALTTAPVTGHAAPAPADTTTEPQPPVVIFDSDMDFDDAATLAYLAQEDRLGRIDLRAVTVTNNGNGLPGRAIRHARCLLQRLGLRDVQVADGSDTAPNAFPAELRQTFDRVFEDVLAGCTASEAPSRIRASELIRQIVARDPAAHVVATGPLSNITAARLGPNRVTSMGGAVRVTGNLCCGTPPEFDGSQEFNYWIDPPASRAALRNLARLVPLDATNDVPITPQFVQHLGAERRTPAADIVYGLVSHPEVAPLIDLGIMSWWDPLTAMSIIHRGIVTFETGRLDVITTGPQAGRTVLSPTGWPVVFATAANAADFEQRFLTTLNGNR